MRLESNVYLNSEETRTFFDKVLSCNLEAIRKRDAFLKGDDAEKQSCAMEILVQGVSEYVMSNSERLPIQYACTDSCFENYCAKTHNTILGDGYNSKLLIDSMSFKMNEKRLMWSWDDSKDGLSCQKSNDCLDSISNAA